MTEQTKSLDPHRRADALKEDFQVRGVRDMTEQTKSLDPDRRADVLKEDFQVRDVGDFQVRFFIL